MRPRHQRVIWSRHGVSTCETAISARPAKSSGTGCHCGGSTAASTTIATPGAAQANDILLVSSLTPAIRGFMRAI